MGVEQFAKSAPGTYSAILMDIRMPVMDGFSATRAIRSLDRADAKTIPIIAMTADVFEEDMKKGHECGIDACIVKPINLKDMSATLGRFIRK